MDDLHFDTDSEEWAEDFIDALEEGCGPSGCVALDPVEVPGDFWKQKPRGPLEPGPPQHVHRRSSSRRQPVPEKEAEAEFHSVLTSKSYESLGGITVNLLPERDRSRYSLASRRSEAGTAASNRKQATLIGVPPRISAVPEDKEATKPKEFPSEERVSNLYGAILALKRQTSRMAEIMGFTDHSDRFADNFIGRMVQQSWYDYLGLFMIVASAVQIGVDTDRSARTADSGASLPDVLEGSPQCCAALVGFEVFFAIFFTLDLLVRFLGYRRWILCLSDGWFLFDTALVTMMDLFTFLLPFVLPSAGDLNKLSGLRLLRLFRLVRMARLLRAFPELRMIVEGLSAAVSAVVWIAVLGLICMFIFALAFTMEFHQGSMSDDDCQAIDQMDPEHICTYFGSVGKSLQTLFTQGTLLDDVSATTYTLRHNSGLYTFLWLVYMGISFAMLMNMLVGVLSSVVASTTEGKRAALMEQEAKEALLLLFEEMDEDKSGHINKREFLALKDSTHAHVHAALGKLGIYDKHLSHYADLFFHPDEDTGEEPELDFQSLLHILGFILPSIRLSKLDIRAFDSFSRQKRSRLKKALDELREKLALVTKEQPRRTLALSEETTSSDGSSDYAGVLQRLHELSSPVLAVELRRRSTERMKKEHAEIDQFLHRALK